MRYKTNGEEVRKEEDQLGFESIKSSLMCGCIKKNMIKKKVDNPANA